LGPDRPHSHPASPASGAVAAVCRPNSRGDIELRDAGHKLEAIRTYLARTSIEGQARVSASERRLEVLIGELLGPASMAGPGRGKPSFANDGLTRNERSDFRSMAENADVVEEVIAESTDEKPASRRKVLPNTREMEIPWPRRGPLNSRCDD